MARGGGYGPGTPRERFDFQTPYLKAYFGNLGVPPENLHLVAAELTRVDVLPQPAGLEDLAAASLTRARATLTALAAVRPQRARTSDRAAARACAAGSALPVMPAVTMAPSASRNNCPASTAGSPASATRPAR